MNNTVSREIQREVIGLGPTTPDSVERQIDALKKLPNVKSDFSGSATNIPTDPNELMNKAVKEVTPETPATTPPPTLNSIIKLF